ncbi:uncharacterized protein [Heptranchias perlo]|uniref:uncharacterized protein n=1 Tax=Heptranchias perlo TaxID=212740 RepID=UPI00355A6F80
MSSTLFEMALLRAISEFSDESELMLYKESPRNHSEILELSPGLFKALISLIKSIPTEGVERSNISVGTGVMEKDGEGVEKNPVDRNVLSKINSTLEKVYHESNKVKTMNNETSVQHLPEKATTNESSVEVTQPTSEEIILVGVSDSGNRDANTSQDHNKNVTKQVVTESVSESNAQERESGLNSLAGQMAKEINMYLQNVGLANETVEMINTSYLYEHGQKFSKLLARLTKVIATAPEVLTMDKKKDLMISGYILHKMLNLSNIALQDLNGQLLGTELQEAVSAKSDKSSLIKKESVEKKANQREFDQIDHFVQMFYDLEEKLSNLKILLEAYEKGKNHEVAKHLLDESLNVVSQMELIPWLKGKNSFIDFELEALRDFAGLLSDEELVQHEPSVGST